MNAQNPMRENLSAYLDGELSAEQTRAMDDALRQDESLRQELEQLRAVRGMLRDLPREEAPAGLADSIVRRVQTPSTGNFWRRVRTASAVAAMLLAVVGLGYMLGTSLHSQPVSESTDETRERGRLAREMPQSEEKPPEPTAAEDHSLADAAESRPMRDEAMREADAEMVPMAGPARDGHELGVAAAGDRTVEIPEVLEQTEQETTIYTDDLGREQNNVERVLIANNIHIASDRRQNLALNEAVNLNRAVPAETISPRSGRSAGDIQVQYVIYAPPAQIARVQQALETSVRQNQVVSQLPEPAYQVALQAIRRSQDLSDAPDAPAPRGAAAPTDGANEGNESTLAFDEARRSEHEQPKALSGSSRDTGLGRQNRSAPAGSASPVESAGGMAMEEAKSAAIAPEPSMEPPARKSETLSPVSLVVTLRHRPLPAVPPEQQKTLRTMEPNRDAEVRPTAGEHGEGDSAAPPQESE